MGFGKKGLNLTLNRKKNLKKKKTNNQTNESPPEQTEEDPINLFIPPALPPSNEITASKSSDDDSICIKKPSYVKMSQTQCRATIAYYFLTILNKPSQELWHQAIDTIEEDLYLPKQNRHRLFQFFHFLSTLSPGEECDGSRRKMRERDNKNMIPADSPEAQIIADCVEGGGSNEAALMLVNQYRMDNQLPLRGLNQISGLLKRLDTISVAVTKGKQGNINADSP